MKVFMKTIDASDKTFFQTVKGIGFSLRQGPERVSREVGIARRGMGTLAPDQARDPVATDTWAVVVQRVAVALILGLE